VTSSDDFQRFQDDFFDRHPEAKALFAQRRAMEQERQQAFDDMDLPELREAAIAALTSAAEAIMNSNLSATTPSDSWTVENKKVLANNFLKMVENIDDNVERPGGMNLSKWFDFYPIEDQLQTIAYEAAEVYNAYLRRGSA
jgi:hypothetical protein